MKLPAFIFVFAFSVQTLFLPQIVSASISSQNPLTADVPVRKIGVLLLAEGTALIRGDEIKIQAKDDSSHMIQELLQGKILDKSSIGSGDKPTLKGRAYFSSGAKIDLLEPHCQGESVELNDGSKISGHISDLTSEGLTISPFSGSSQHLAMSAISKIHSPKVFNYTIQPDAKGMLFESTCTPTTSVHVHKGLSKKQVAAVIVVGVVLATAISCGVAIPVALHHHHHAPQTPIISIIRPTPVTQVQVPGTHFTIPVRQGTGVSILNARPRFPRLPVQTPTGKVTTISVTPVGTPTGGAGLGQGTTIQNTNPLGPPIFRIVPRSILLNTAPAPPVIQ